MKSPFKFLDAYSREDKDIFFGRSEEVSALLEMSKKNRLILVYGPSGAGKTSLVQCGLSNRFHPTDWYPLFIRRNNNINRSLEEALAEGLDSSQYSNPVEAIQELYVEYLRPVYLIFDQLEELLILGGEEEQQRFVQDIAAIQEAKMPCRILFILREEYLAHLFHFEKAIPRLFTRRLRVEPMARADVREVIMGSCKAFNITFENEEDNPGHIIDNISQGKTGVFLPYLQAYLDGLYQAGFQRRFGRAREGEELPELTFTTGEIEAFGAIENVLQQFLSEQSTHIQATLQQKHPAVGDNLTRQVLDAFVTERGTKRPIPFRTEGQFLQVDTEVSPFLNSLPAEQRTDCLRALQDSRILHDEGNVFELAHDSLAALIDESRTDEQRQRNEARKRISNAYAEYQASGLFLTRRQLASIEHVLEEIAPALSAEARAFIQESYRQVELEEQAELEEERRKRRRAWRVAGGFGVLALLTLAAAIAAFIQFKNARKATALATSRAFEASYLNAVLLKKEGLYAEALEQVDALDMPGLRPGAADSLNALEETIQQLQQNVARGDSLAREGKLHEALITFRSAYALSPDSIILRSIQQKELELETTVRNLLRTGDAMLRAKSYDEALKYYPRALELSPENPDIHFRLARAYALLQNAGQAFHHLERAVELGFERREEIREDYALAFLRAQPEFSAFAANGYRRTPE